MTGALAGLLALPAQAAGALLALADSAQALPGTIALVRGRLVSLDERVGDLLGEVEVLPGALTDVDGRVSAIDLRLQALMAEVEQLTERLPDPNAPGPLERARDALTVGDRS